MKKWWAFYEALKKYQVSLLKRLISISLKGASVGQQYIFIADFDADTKDSARAHDTWQLLKTIGDDESMRTNLSAVLFLGDMAYEFWQNNGKNFSDWLNDIDTLAKRYPLMMSAGNHEANFNYSFFDQRLQMPLYDQNKGNR